jgi:hypothetical protein
MQLTSFPKKKYSMLEYHVFDMLPKRGRKVKARELVEARLRLGPWKAKNKMNVINVVMNNLIEKVELNNENFRIRKEERYPSHPEVEYWLEPKKKR